MGDGLKLKGILDRKELSVRKVALDAGIKPTTLYSIIQKDANISVDKAVRIAHVIGVDPASICEDFGTLGPSLIGEIPSAGDFWLNLRPTDIESPDTMNYIKKHYIPLLDLYMTHCEENLAERLLSSFFLLNNEARKEVIDIIDLKLSYQVNPKNQVALDDILAKYSKMNQEDSDPDGNDSSNA